MIPPKGGSTTGYIPQIRRNFKLFKQERSLRLLTGVLAKSILTVSGCFLVACPDEYPVTRVRISTVLQ